MSVYDIHVLCLVIFDINDAVKYDFDDGYGYLAGEHIWLCMTHMYCVWQFSISILQ